jgi:hypothetical protein
MYLKKALKTCFITRSKNAFDELKHRPLTKGRITQQSSPERDKGNAFSKNVFLASREGTKLGTQPKFKLSWLNG